MKLLYKSTLIPLSIILIVSLACNFPLSKPQLENAILSRDYDGNLPTSVFMEQDTFYGIASLVNSPGQSNVKATWKAINPEGIEPNLIIEETEIKTSSGIIHFELNNLSPWPRGFYQLILDLNGELIQVLNFEVK